MSTPVVLSIQVGKPAVHGPDHISNKPWESGIFKSPVGSPVWLDTLNLTGDGQQDLNNHGGPFRAVLAYAASHYPIWEAELGQPLPGYGAFGENFTVSELGEDTVCLGDIYAVGEARVQITQPRSPCWKLARRIGLKDMAARVEARSWGGWYHRVLQTGCVEAGQAYQLIERPYPQYPILRLNDLAAGREVNPEICLALAEVEALSPGWREMYAALADSTATGDEPQATDVEA